MSLKHATTALIWFTPAAVCVLGWSLGYGDNPSYTSADGRFTVLDHRSALILNYQSYPGPIVSPATQFNTDWRIAGFAVVTGSERGGKMWFVRIPWWALTLMALAFGVGATRLWPLYRARPPDARYGARGFDLSGSTGSAPKVEHEADQRSQ